MKWSIECPYLNEKDVTWYYYDIKYNCKCTFSSISGRMVTINDCISCDRIEKKISME